MKLHHNIPGIKIPLKPPKTTTNKISTILDPDMNLREAKHDIILNISLDGNELADFFSYLAEKSLSEESSQTIKVNENAVKQLPGDEAGLKHRLWVDEKTYLTCREVEIMELLLKGWLIKEIAVDLTLSDNTIRNHLQNIYHKLGIGNRSEAIIVYQKCLDKNKNMSTSD
jgi:DNA-binding NarL/FixJ family response regulator